MMEVKTSAQNKYFELIKQISGQKNVITVPRLFVKITGNMTQAVILSQCLYWSDKGTRPDGWFYKAAHEWADELGITYNQARHSINNLRDAGFIETKLHRANGSPTLHYRVCFEKITESICNISQIDLAQETNPIAIGDNSLTESTSEITSSSTTAADQKFDEPFETMMNLFTQTTGCPMTGGKDALAITAFLEAGVIQSDIQDAIAFFKEKGIKVYSAAQIQKSVLRSVTQRTQNANASKAPGNNGHRSRSAPYIPGQARPGEKNSGELALDSENEFRVSQGLPKMTWDEYIARNQATQDARAAREAAEEAAREPEPVKKETHPRDYFTFEQYNAIRATNGQRDFTEEEYLNA
jgi:hypothetical protein